MSGNGVPRSDLVHSPGLAPAQSTSSSLNTASHSSLSLSPSRTDQDAQTPATPPAVPVRSPLRPPPKSIAASQASSGSTSRSSRATLDTPPLSGIEDFTVIVSSEFDDADMREQDAAFASIGEMLEAVKATAADPKAAQTRPGSPILASIEPRSRVPRKRESVTSASSLPTQASAATSNQTTVTKRQHALHELLSSERAYASDLALIREVHIPLALGNSSITLPNLPASPPNSSGSSSRTLSTASDASTTSLNGPPMTQEDARIIFTNISELALFSDLFCEELESALGSIVEGGTGDDRVGELFLRIIPDLERPYQHYITRHPTALQHLQSLPQTPALQAYFAYTQNVASSLSHAWDLASLLIKPVQRLLKYPLLLSAIIDETPDTHPDKANLRNARLRMEEVARNVNEIRRRAEVVKDVLTSKKKAINVTVAASVNLGKMKNLRPGLVKGPHNEDNGEAAQVEKMSQELKRIELFAQQFAKNVVEWSRSMTKVITALRMWAVSFGKVIGLSAEQGSEAFDAFLATVEDQIMPLAIDLEAVVNEKLLKEIAHLLQTMNQPYKLIASMQEQEPFHWHLLNMNVSSKNRPPAALLAASTNYLALRAQLAAELPTYIAMLHRGMALSVLRLSDIQTHFWSDVREQWAELWEMLRVDGELNAGHEETVAVWHSRWSDVDEVVASLNINQAKKIYQEPERARPSTTNLHAVLSSLDPGHAPAKRHGGVRPNSFEAPAPSTYPAGYVSQPFPLAPSTRRGRPHTEDASAYYQPQSLSRRGSNESLFTTSRKAKGKSPRRRSEREEHGHGQSGHHPPPHPYGYDHSGAAQHGGLPRRKSMPLPSDVLGSNTAALRRNTSPHPRGGGYEIYDDEDGHYGPHIYHPYSAPVQPGTTHHLEHRDREREAPTKLARSGSSKKKGDDGKHRQSQNRQRSSSVTSFFKVMTEKDTRERGDSPPVPPLLQGQDIMPGYRDSWVTKPAKYICTVAHPCQPPATVSYYSFPFFTLRHGELYEVLQETGHPSIHPKLPLYVDDGEDCLLLCRNGTGMVGWALASFLEPINLPR